MSKRTQASSRVLTLHAEFKPDGDPRDNMGSLMKLWLEAQTHLGRVGMHELRRKEEEWDELTDAVGKLGPLIAEVFSGKRASLDAAEDASELVPDKELRKKAFGWVSSVLASKPEDLERERAELATARREMEVRAKHGRDKKTVADALMRLSDAVIAGEPGAAEALSDAVRLAAQFLSISVGKHPEQFKEVAAKSKSWPVLASTEIGWEKKAMSEVVKLELGKDLAKLRSPLRKLRGADVHLPARRWAKAAVGTIDETRWRFSFFTHIVKQLGGKDRWAEFAVTCGWDLEKYPSWATTAINLKPFSTQTLDDWKVVVRNIIREQVSDFHLLPEWATQRATAEANGRHTPGEIQNAILDDIVSALKRLAPDASC